MGESLSRYFTKAKTKEGINQGHANKAIPVYCFTNMSLATFLLALTVTHCLQERSLAKLTGRAIRLDAVKVKTPRL